MKQQKLKKKPPQTNFWHLVVVGLSFAAFNVRCNNRKLTQTDGVPILQCRYTYKYLLMLWLYITDLRALVRSR